MIINRSQENGKLVFALDGRLDATTAPNLQVELMAALSEAKDVELDFTKIAYVSSAGLRVLLLGEKEAKAKGAAMVVRGVSEEVMEVFEMTGFDNVLTIAR